ncbi:hypothetical protein GCM10010470_63630 [Saccharopolyspora taberi]|uniref:Uncharacterized protein n=2 Tax=Saccharopolyspora taberi TaxID=60895 RepID=A0ABN3VP00_9PSEU
MLRTMAKVLAPALLLAASVAAAPAAQAETPRTFRDCVGYAVDHGVHPELAYHACGAITFEHCYEIFRKEWVPASIAYHACKLREA